MGHGYFDVLRRIQRLGRGVPRRGNLRSLISAAFLTELGVSMAFPLRLLYAQAHHAPPAEARGRAQGIAGLVGSLGGAGSAFFSLSLDHWNRPAPFVISGTVMAAGAIAAALGAVWLARNGAERPAATPAS